MVGGVLAGIYHYWAIGLYKAECRRETAQYENEQLRERTGIWVFKDSLIAGKRIRADNIIKVVMATDVAPKQVLDYPDQIIGKVLKIDVSPRTPVSLAMLYEDEKIADDLRWVETAVIQLPLRLQERDVIDVRLRFPNGQDYVILSKKEIKSIQYPIIWAYLDEQERLLFSSACVDAYINGGQIYALQYIEPRLQSKAVPNYLANEQVLKLMSINPNIVKKANTDLARIVRKEMEQAWAQQPKLSSAHYPLTGKSDKAMHNSPFVGRLDTEHSIDQRARKTNTSLTTTMGDNRYNPKPNNQPKSR